MRRVLSALAVTLAAAVLAGCGATSANQHSPGAEIVVQPLAAPGQTVSAASLAASTAIIRNRVSRLGDKGSVTGEPRSGRIEIRLDGVSVAAARGQVG